MDILGVFGSPVVFSAPFPFNLENPRSATEQFTSTTMIHLSAKLTSRESKGAPGMSAPFLVQSHTVFWIKLCKIIGWRTSLGVDATPPPPPRRNLGSATANCGIQYNVPYSTLLTGGQSYAYLRKKPITCTDNLFNKTSMHFNRMCTASLLTVSCSIRRCVCPRGVVCPGSVCPGICLTRGCLPVRGCLTAGGCLPAREGVSRGMYAQGVSASKGGFLPARGRLLACGIVCPGGVCPWGGVCPGGVYPGGVFPPPSREKNHRQV